MAALDIPLYTIIHNIRRTLPAYLISLLQSLGSTCLFANIEYELDELRRDITVCTLAKEHSIKGVFVHDRCVVEPGVIQTKGGKTYTVSTSCIQGHHINKCLAQVYSPYQRTWSSTVNANIPYYLENCEAPHPNASSIRTSDKFGPLFNTPVPESVAGFELSKEDQIMMEKIWPAGEEAALNVRVCLSECIP